MTEKNIDQTDYCVDRKKSALVNAFWAVLWVGSTFLASFGPRFIWDYATVSTVIAVLANLTFGALMLFHTIQHIK